jgi:hypothetical protein
MECDGGGVIPGSNQYGAIYYGMKNNLLAFAEAVQEEGFRVDIEEF